MPAFLLTGFKPKPTLPGPVDRINGPRNPKKFKKCTKSRRNSKEIKYWNVYDGTNIFLNTDNGKDSNKQNRQNNELKSIQWFSKTCPFAEDCRGIWRGPNSTPDDVRAMDFYPSKKPINHLDGTIAVANDYGKLQLYKSPCRGDEPVLDTYRAHSLHLTNVKFTCDGKKILTIGGLDRCIMQWNIKQRDLKM